MLVLLKQARPFSEGIAWVLYEDPSGNEQIGWLHADGHIDQPFPIDKITQLRKNYSYCSGLGSKFSGGYSYINTGDAFVRGSSEVPDSFLILNQEGEITAQSPDDGHSYEILCGGDGVYLVKQSIRSMTEKEDQYGFISGDGNWLHECSSCEQGNGHPLSNTEGRSTMNEIAFEYLGNGVFSAVYSRGQGQFYEKLQMVLYNVNNKKTYRLSSNSSLYGRFSNDMMPVNSEGTLYMMSTDFEFIPITVDTTDTVIYSNGIIFTANRNYSGNRSTYLTNAKFYRTDGTVVADLSEYELLYEDAYELYRYSEGYAAIIVCGIDGKQYLGIIDLEGNFVFEPKKISDPTNHDYIGTFSNGVIVVCLEGENSGARIINIAGEEIQSDYIEANRIDDFVFYDGYACDDENKYYIGIDGNPLEPHVISN